MDEKTLLVVDDIEMNREMLRINFKDKFKVLAAANGVEAMKLIETNHIDILITDIFMEPMNGYELIQKIRERKEYRKIPIIAVTESDDASRKRALKAGADDLIYKPFISSILHNRVDGLLFDGYDIDKYFAAYENNPIPFILYHVIDRPDIPNYKIMYMNKSAREVYSPPFIEDLIHTDENPQLIDFLLDSVKSGETLQKSIYEQELKKWLDWTIYPDGSGLVAAMIHDITGEVEKQTEEARKNARKAISELNEISEIIETIPDGIFVFHIVKNDIVILEANSSGCRLLDVNQQKVIGVNKSKIMSFVYSEDQKIVLNAMEELQKPDSDVAYKCRILNRSKNEYVWFLAHAHSKLRPDGSVYAFISYNDISAELELAKVKTELLAVKKANKAKIEFLSRVSHDMRTPLNGILGMTSLIKEKVADANVIQDLEQMQMSEQYLLNLIKDTLDVSRIESGKLELNPIVCDGRTIFNNVISLIQPSLKAKNMHFQIKAENIPFTILYIDVGRAEQVVMNLLSNAIKFTPEGGNIYFTMENLMVKDDIITDRITIEDDGIGMSDEFFPHLFEPFAQENGGTTSTTQGTGLGMGIVKQIIELMGGTIRVESKKGVGTKVILEVPMKIATENQVKEWNDRKTEVFSTDLLDAKRVLLCEDNQLNATIAKRLLEKKGMLVEHAGDGQLGVEMFEKSAANYYDIILMDIRMPVMDGLDATKAIRALPRSDAKTIPVVAMTANAFDEDVKNSRDVGMDAHLSKPIDTGKLYGTIEQMLKLKKVFKRKKILIVDDVELNREIIKEALQDEYAIVEAGDGIEALDKLQSIHDIDAVITDIQMPEMDGMELIKNIRALPELSRIAILANTQYGDPRQEETLLSIGADDFVYKPSTPMIVKARVRNILKK